MAVQTEDKEIGISSKKKKNETKLICERTRGENTVFQMLIIIL
jgi:hypothetical protein